MKFEINGRITKKQRGNIAKELWICNQIIDNLMGLIAARSSDEVAKKIYNNILAKIAIDEEKADEIFVLDLSEFSESITKEDPIDIAITVLEETAQDSGLDVQAKKMFHDALKKHSGDPVKAFETSALMIEKLIQIEKSREIRGEKEKNKEELSFEEKAVDENSIFNPKKLYDLTDLLLELDPDGKEF